MSMTWDFILRLFVAGALGTVIGLDREYRAKEAGYRTHFLVSLGSALIMIVSQYGFMEVVKMEGIDLDPSRVAAQVVSGIGFIGAGTIIFQKQIVRGLTTAAGIWATSGIGLAIGAGMYWLGISATILTLIGLEALSYLFKSIGMKSSMVEFSTDNKETLNRMAKKFNSKEYNIVSYQLDEKRLGEVTTYYVTMVIKSKKYNDEGMLLTLLQDLAILPFIGWSKLFRLGSKAAGRALIERFSPLCCDHAFNRITNVLPSPNLLSTVSVPLWASTKSREMDKT